MQVVCPVRDQTADALGLDQVDEMATGQVAQPGVGDSARQLTARGRGHHGVPAAGQHESRTFDGWESRAGVARQRQLGLRPIGPYMSAWARDVAQEQIAREP